MIQKVMLVNPPNIMLDDSVRRIAEPIGILYIAAALEEAGFEVDVFDMACEGYEKETKISGYLRYGSTNDDLIARIKEKRPDVIGVSCMFNSRETITLEICQAIKEFDAKIIVTVGGIPPTQDYEKFLKSGVIDYVIMEEGELRTCQLLKNLNAGCPVTENLDGIAYLQDGRMKVNPPMEKIMDLDALPHPARHLVNMEKYFEIGRPMAPFSLKKRVAHIYVTRGCPQNCIFCASVQFWGRKVRKRSIENVVDEIRQLIERYGVEEIQFIDDNITADARYAEELFRRLKEFQIKWCTPNGLFFNHLNQHLIALMVESGAYQLTLAIESGNPRVLKEIIHKNVHLNKVKEIVEEIHRYDISVHAMFIVGFPGETKQEILNTLEFPFRIGFDSVSYFIAAPLKGTRLFQLCQEKQYLSDQKEVIWDFKSARIQIPKDAEDYVIDPQELEQLVDDYTRRYNEWSKELYPERFARKFKRYLQEHPEEKELIKGRVT